MTTSYQDAHPQSLRRIPLSAAAAQWAVCKLCGQRIGRAGWAHCAVSGLYCSTKCANTAAREMPTLLVPSKYRTDRAVQV
jgi:hypothetical protein